MKIKAIIITKIDMIMCKGGGYVDNWDYYEYKDLS